MSGVLSLAAGRGGEAGAAAGRGSSRTCCPGSCSPGRGGLAAGLDPTFLTETGWDPTAGWWSPPPHRLLGRPICAAPGCSTTAEGVSGAAAGWNSVV